MRLKLVPSETTLDFFRLDKLSLSASALAMIASIVFFLMIGLNYGIDFRGGTTIRTDAQNPVDIVAYRAALAPLGLGDISITEVIDPADQLSGTKSKVSQIRIEAQEGAEAATIATIKAVKSALVDVDPTMSFPQVDSVGPKV